MNHDLSDDMDHALDDALASLLAPIARLALQRGLTFQTVEDHLKRAFVAEAYEAHEALAAHRRVSRVAITTGLSRREVGRLMNEISQGLSPRRASMAATVAQAWRTQATWCDASGKALRLARQGSGPGSVAVPSFEALAWSLTKDVHPRSLLEEMLRLGLVDWDETSDTVSLRPEPAPSTNPENLRLLAEHVADHLSAGVANLSGVGASHLEEALSAGGLPAHALDEVLDLVEEQWQKLVEELRPRLESLIEATEAPRSGKGVAGPGRSGQGRSSSEPTVQRLRVGLYTWTAPE